MEKVGFRIVFQGEHIVTSNGDRILTIPRHNPVNALTISSLFRDGRLTVEGFKKLV